MDPVHRLIISGASFKRFKWVCAAYRTNGGIYEIDTQTLVKLYPDLSKKQAAINDALFILSEVKNSIGEYYLTIIDRDSKNAISKYRWAPISERKFRYWHNGDRVAYEWLHQYVIYLSGQTVYPGNEIHHKDFYTFDNRRGSLSVVPKKATPTGHPKSHRQLHRGVKIAEKAYIKTDPQLAEFLMSVF